MKSKWIGCFCLSLTLLACQSAPSLQPPTQAPGLVAKDNPVRLASIQRRVALPVYQLPPGKITIKPSAQADTANIRVEMTLPKATDFSTQALALNNIAKIKAQIQGIGISSPIYAQGADGNGMLVNPGGTFTLTFNNVPYGAGRWLTLLSYNNSDQEIEGAYAVAGFHLNAASTNLELSFRSKILGDLIAILNTHAGGVDDFPTTGSVASDQYLLSNLDLGTLQSFIEADLIGLSGSAPNYEYNTHPFLIANRVLAEDLVTHQGNISELVTLNTNDPTRYRLNPGSVSYTLAGLINPDTASVVVRDPASGQVVGQSNGSGTINNVAPGTWKVEASAPSYTADISPTITIPPNGGTQNAGIITFSVASTPVIDSLSTSSGTIGSQVTLTGSNFHSTIAGNSVFFNGIEADIVSASETELVVEVPTAPSGNVTVEVGGQTSNSLSFNVLPTLAFTSPGNMAILSGVVPLTVNHTSGNPVTKVEYYYGPVELGGKIGESTVAPYTLNWDSSTAPLSGPTSLFAKLTDGQNNEVTSRVDVTVDQIPVISALTASINPIIGLSHPTRLSCSASDTEGTPTISWSTVGGSFGSFSSTTGSQVYWTAPASAGGPYTIRCSVDDGVNEPVTQDLSVSVTSGTGTVNSTGGLY